MGLGSVYMDVKASIANLRAHKEFNEWYDKNKEAKLVHIFMMMEPGKAVGFDIGFYNFNKELMTSFFIDKDSSSVKITESNEIFAQDNQKINPLEEDRLKVNFDKALEIAFELQKEKYKQYVPMKEVIVLQNLDIGQVWNITFITKQFKTLNIKIDAETGKLLEDKLHAIFSFDK